MTGIDILKKLSRFGTAPRAAFKNDLSTLSLLIKSGLVQKVYKRGRVFYELTASSLDALNHIRLLILEEARLRMLVHPRRGIYHALLDDIRFLDTSAKEAEDFLFLGDWRLKDKPVKSQLMLAKHRFYEKRGLE